MGFIQSQGDLHEKSEAEYPVATIVLQVVQIVLRDMVRIGVTETAPGSGLETLVLANGGARNET